MRRHFDSLCLLFSWSVDCFPGPAPCGAIVFSGMAVSLRRCRLWPPRCDPIGDIGGTPRYGAASDADRLREFSRLDAAVEFGTRERTSLANLLQSKKNLVHLTPHYTTRDRPGR